MRAARRHGISSVGDGLGDGWSESCGGTVTGSKEFYCLDRPSAVGGTFNDL